MSCRATWKPEPLAELKRRARAGESWAAIGAVFYPGNPRGGHIAHQAFARYAEAGDKRARRAAVAENNHNRPAQYHPGTGHQGPGGAPLEPAVGREWVDRLAGMGNVFAL